jgi:hypothetical protein
MRFKAYQHLFVNAKKYVGLDMENEGHSHEKEDVDVYYDGKTILLKMIILMQFSPQRFLSIYLILMK